MTSVPRKPTAKELVAARRAQAPATTPAPSAPTSAPAPVRAVAAVAATPEAYRQRYLSEIAPNDLVGRLVKFDKTGKFITSDDGEDIDEAAEFVALCDQTVCGYQKFNGPGSPPDKIMGALYDGFTLPPVESLPDRDETTWEDGLDGNPQDPWQHTILLVLQDTRTSEMFTFSTASKTGRRAVGALLKHFDRMQKTNAGELPVVRLRTGSFPHRDERIGTVNVPTFVVVGRAPRDSVAKPDTSLGTFLQDEIPFEMTWK